MRAQPALRLALQILLPLLVLAFGYWAAQKIRGFKPQAKVDPDAFVGPIVRTAIAAQQDIRIDIAAQGVVEAARSIQLSPEVSGRVIEVSPALRAGGFFATDDVLLKIDPADYELAVVQQESAVARARLRVLQEKAEADAAIRAWRKLEGDRPADDLVKRVPQIEDAEKALAAAEALLNRTRLDLARTTVKAPFAGRVRTANVDIGQVVRAGAAIAEIYGIEAAEVRLPLPASDVAFLELPMQWQGSRASQAGPHVEFTADFAGRRTVYQGTIARTEGEVDRKTRQLTVVARVDAPYGAPAPGELPESAQRPPLALGMFVDAKIQGRMFRGVLVIPREALTSADRVWIVDAEHRLRPQKVDVLRVEPTRVLVRSGIAAGDVICTSALDAPIDGMPVRLLEENRDE
ncbi:MAG: efflux RND transporter periplasmic adaptor subunit [bacterium]|nr:efflux RND transporter periplasmic adaptor subunit [bacterium]